MESGDGVARSKGVSVGWVIAMIIVVALSSATVLFFYIQTTVQQNEIASLQEGVSDLESQVASLQSNITSLEAQVVASYEEGYDDGYLEGVKDGAGTGYNIRDPTYREAVQFIASDQTDKNEYDKVSYNCFHYTADVKNNAFDIGFRCGFVFIDYDYGPGHAIVCFDTVDQGLIYVEPQTDEEVTITVGHTYLGDTIVSFTIIW